MGLSIEVLGKEYAFSLRAEVTVEMEKMSLPSK
jgi:hypothetical protein